MPVRHQFWIRAGLYGESLREAGLLLAIFGPIASFEVIRALPVKLALALWSSAALMLILKSRLKSLRIDIGNEEARRSCWALPSKTNERHEYGLRGVTSDCPAGFHRPSGCGILTLARERAGSGRKCPCDEFCKNAEGNRTGFTLVSRSALNGYTYLRPDLFNSHHIN